MAAVLHFPEADFVLGPPPGYSQLVLPLPVRRLADGQLVSCWALNADELATIARTGKVWLSVWAGLGHPPVKIAAAMEDLVE